MTWCPAPLQAVAIAGIRRMAIKTQMVDQRFFIKGVVFCLIGFGNKKADPHSLIPSMPSGMNGQDKRNLAPEHNTRRLSRQHTPVIIGQWSLPVFPASNAPPQSLPSSLPSATTKLSGWSTGFV